MDRWADVPTLYTNRFAVALDIRASDSQSGIAAVSIDDDELFIESIEKDFNEPAVVAIDPQQRTRTVTIKVLDLAGNESRSAAVRLVVDTIPPTATIRVNPDNKTLFGAHIPVEIAAADDRGLKSVQVGGESYDSRDCHSESEWRGVFYAKPGTVELPVSVSDCAGNVTAANIRIEPEQLTYRAPARYEFSDSPPLSYGNGQWSDAFTRRPQRLFRSRRLLGFHPATYLPNTIYGPARMERLTSDRASYPVPRLVFPDFRGTKIVRTSNDSYLLQGEVRHANGLVDIRIAANGQELESRRQVNKGDYVIFCESIPLPDYGKDATVVTVQAYFQDDSIITSPDLYVERVSDYISEPNSVYAVALLPLEQKRTPADPNDQHKDPNMAHDTVLEVLRTCRLHHPDDPNRTFPRFNCDAIEGWTEGGMTDELRKLRVAEGSAEKKFAALQAKYADAQRPSIDLGFFGETREDAKSIEIILRVINVKEGKFLFSRIDIFGNKDDYDWCRKGLVSKLQKAIRRVYGEVSCGKRSGDIVIDRGRSDGVFRNMDVNLYRPLKNGGFHPLTRATIKEVRRGDSTIRSTSTKLWNDVCDIDYGVKAIAISK
jgi:hypothetical protein